MPETVSEILDCEFLETLDCSLNNFSAIPKDFRMGKSKTSLRYINMHCCRIECPNFFYEMTNCNNLEKLDLSNNNLEFLKLNFKSTSYQKSLKWLNLKKSKIVDLGIFLYLRNFEKLEFLDISNNNLSNILINPTLEEQESINTYNDLGLLKSVLKHLNLRDCQLSNTGPILSWLKDCKALEFLDLSTNDNFRLTSDIISGPLIDSLIELKLENIEILDSQILLIATSFTNIKALTIVYNNLEIISTDFKLGISTKSLIKITLNSSNLRLENVGFSNILVQITKCERLIYLNISSRRNKSRFYF